MRLDTAADLAELQRTLDDLVGDDGRVEVIGGEVVVTPAPDLSHQRLAARLLRLLADLVPDDLEVLPEVDVSTDLSGDRREPYWRPDLVVATRGVDRAWLVASEVLVAVEIVSTNNTRAGGADAYLAGRSAHGDRHGVRWLLGVDPVERRRSSWWSAGRQVAEGPSWAAGLRFDPR